MSDKKSRLEWFPFYASDFLDSDNVQFMSMAERGLYITLLAMQWRSETLPDDERELAKRVGLQLRSFKTLWKQVAFKFVKVSDGRLANERLQSVRKQQVEYLNSRIEAGKASAEKRWGGNRPMGSVNGSAVQSKYRDKEEHTEPVCESQDYTGIRALNGDRKPWEAPQPDDPSPEDVGAFLDAYRELYERLTGAKLPLVWTWKDMGHVKEILKTWPLSVPSKNGKRPRVLELAEIFITDPVNANKPKSLGMFKANATHADEKMRKFGV